MKKIKLPKNVTGYGYSGVWSDNKLGWWMPCHIHQLDSRKYPHVSGIERSNDYTSLNERTYLCKITVTLVKDKLGRPITRQVRK